MPYSPEDIVAYAFRTRARGYDRDEVDGFLDELADQIEQERARATALEERVATLESELAEADESERALKRTLITVQDAADRALAEAREEVAELRAEADREVTELRERTDRQLAEQRSRAEAEAAEVVAAARAAAAAQHDRVRELQELDAGHRGRLRAHLEGELAALAELPDPFADLELDPAGTAAGDPAGPGVGGDPAGTGADDHAGPGVGGEPADASGGASAPDEVEHDPWRRAPDPERPQPGAGVPGEVRDGDPGGAQAPGDGAEGGDDAEASGDGDGRDEDRGEPPMWG